MDQPIPPAAPTSPSRALRLLALLPLLAGVAGISACSSDDDGALVEDVVEPVDVIDNSFRPASLEVAAGTEVVWENRGRNAHDVLPVDGDDWGVAADQFQPKATYSHRFTEAGTYEYYCSLHGTTTKGMVGTIVVTK